jgi:electron transport complex protein RnfG
VSRLRNSYLGQAWLILLLAGVFGALLAAIHLEVSPRIEENIRAEIMREIPGLLLGGEAVAGASLTIVGDQVGIESASGESTSLTVVEQPSEASALYRVSEGDPEGRLLGWVARGQDHGYADVIELLVGLTGDTTQITGIYVLNQKETPALGDGIVRSDFRQHFAGIATDSPLTVGRDAAEAAQSPYAIQALTGATVSSRSVCKIVNDTVALVKVEIAEEPEGVDGRP